MTRACEAWPDAANFCKFSKITPNAANEVEINFRSAVPFFTVFDLLSSIVQLSQNFSSIDEV